MSRKISNQMFRSNNIHIVKVMDNITSEKNIERLEPKT